MLNFEQYSDVDLFIEILIEEGIENSDVDEIEFLELNEIQELISLDEKLSVKAAIQAKKGRKKRGRTAAGKLAARKLKIKTSRSSYRPDKGRSRAASKAQKRVRRKLPTVSA
ncbi:MAG: hypothetical protein QM489_01200 [Candidatus Izemoplasma sp.]